MVYTINRPTASEKLKVSQPLIRDNFNSANVTMGIDHYPFDDLTANNGFHKKVTTPEFDSSGHTEPVTGANPIFCAIQKSANLGVLQFSKGPNQAVPTPVTNRISQSGPISIIVGATTDVLDISQSGPISIIVGATTDVLDCSGLGQFMAELFMANFSNSGVNSFKFSVTSIAWLANGGAGSFLFIAAGGNSSFLTATSTGNILQIENTGTATMNNVFWSLRFQRIN